MNPARTEIDRLATELDAHIETGRIIDVDYSGPASLQIFSLDPLRYLEYSRRKPRIIGGFMLVGLIVSDYRNGHHVDVHMALRNSLDVMHGVKVTDRNSMNELGQLISQDPDYNFF